MKCALLIDFGSTYTKLRLVDLDRRALLSAAQGPSTVTTDVNIGLRAAMAALEQRLGYAPQCTYRLACSSAAGGLRMVTVGLVRELTAEAARQAALGAGARLVGTYAYRLTDEDVRAIVDTAPDILLLAGGTDGGNSEVVLANAAALGSSDLRCPVVYAGNRAVAAKARDLLAGKRVWVAENVMPEFRTLNIDSAREAIREIFIARIVSAKGIDKAQELVDSVLMPTPSAVLEGAKLVADGIADAAGLGDLLVVDPGGATTDVHSVASGEPASGVILQGLPEPRVKRTVEGDLGMRHNAGGIVEAAGEAALAQSAGLGAESLRHIVSAFTSRVERVPETPDEQAVDSALVAAATDIAVSRHCGSLETVYTVTGPAVVQRGKDLRGVRAVIGTGGAVVSSRHPEAILKRALSDPSRPLSLRPERPRMLLDRDYLLYAVGLLASVEPEAALQLALGHLVPVMEEPGHERAN